MKLWLKRKLNNRKGFSLTELLAAVLILSMVSAVVAGGIPVAKDAYEKITLSANAQVMLSTSVSALRNELCKASEVKVVSGKTDTVLEYFSTSIQNYSQISLKDIAGNDTTDADKATDVVVIQYSHNTESGKNPPQPHKLVSAKAGDDRLHVIYSSLSYDNGVVVITGLKVVELDSGGNRIGNPRAELDSLKIRIIMT